MSKTELTFSDLIQQALRGRAEQAVADTRGGAIIFTQALVLKSGSTRKFLF